MQKQCVMHLKNLRETTSKEEAAGIASKNGFHARQTGKNEYNTQEKGFKPEVITCKACEQVIISINNISGGCIVMVRPFLYTA